MKRNMYKESKGRDELDKIWRSRKIRGREKKISGSGIKKLERS